MAGGFHPLRVTEVERLTESAVAVTFDVPDALRTAYRHTAGQHLTVRMTIQGREIRRTYSICTPAPGPEGPGHLKVGIRLVEGGEFSTFANKELNVGDVLEVMRPAGRFTVTPRSGYFAAVVGGSGITPVLSLAATLLAEEPDTRFCLVRCDRTVASAMFFEEVADLKDRYPDRMQVAQLLTREERQTGFPSGRLDEKRLTRLLPALLPVSDVEGWFLCGPHGLVTESMHALNQLGVKRTRIHQEIFHVDETLGVSRDVTGTGQTTSAKAINATPSLEGAGAGRMSAQNLMSPSTNAGRTVAAKLGGRSGSWPAQSEESALDTVLRNRSDAPFACKGGVCGTCRAFLVSGAVRMERNFALEPEEVAAGYVLACQSQPTTDRIELDFDR